MAYIESALYVDSAQYSLVAQWAATHAYSVGNIVRQLAAPTAGNERCFICLVAGTSVAAEPAWVLTRGAATNETTVHWMECTGLPALNGDSANTRAWAPNAGAIAIGWIIKNGAGTSYFICTTAGTGGTGAEPTWNTTAGATTTDGSVTWTCLGATSVFSGAWKSPHATLRPPLNGSANWLPNTGMNVFVGDDHVEAPSSGAIQYQIIGLTTVSVICIDHTVALPAGSTNLKTTALISITGTASVNFLLTANVFVYIYGLQFVASGTITNHIVLAAGGTSRYLFEQCLFSYTATTTNAFTQLGDNSAVSLSQIEYKNCTFNLAAVSQSLRISGPNVRMENCSFTGTLAGSGNQLFSGLNQPSNLVLEGCDFSNVPSGGSIVGGGGTNEMFGNVLIKDCLIPSGVNIHRGVINSPCLSIDVNRSDSANNYRNERHNYYGDETTSSSVVRTGGAIDGVTPVSHQVATNGNVDNIRDMFYAVPYTIWNAVTGGNRNVTIYGIANDSRVPNNDEVWFDYEYLGSATSPKGSYTRGSKANVLAAGSALTADTSAWDSQVTARVNSHVYALGDVIKTVSNAGRIFFCTTAGTTAPSEPGGYASAVDGGSVTDGTATFRAGCRFLQTLTLSSPQPQQAGYMYCYPRFGRASMMYYLDPMINLS